MAAVLGLESLGIGLLVHLLPLVVLLEAEPGLAIGMVACWLFTSWPQSCWWFQWASLYLLWHLAQVPLADLLAQDPGQRLGGTLEEQMAM